MLVALVNPDGAIPIRLRVHPWFRARRQGDPSSVRGLVCAPLSDVHLDLPSTSVKHWDWIADVTGCIIH